MIEIALMNGISRQQYRQRLSDGWDKKRAATQEVRKRADKYTGDYAVYRKGEPVVMGTRKECAEFLGVSEEYIHWMTTATGIKRRNERKNPEMAMAAVKLDD